jgi:hypothetical protein
MTEGGAYPVNNPFKVYLRVVAGLETIDNTNPQKTLFVGKFPVELSLTGIIPPDPDLIIAPKDLSYSSSNLPPQTNKLKAWNNITFQNGVFPQGISNQTFLAGGSIDLLPGSSSTELNQEMLLMVGDISECTAVVYPYNDPINNPVGSNDVKTFCRNENGYKLGRGYPSNITEIDSTESAVDDGDKSLKKSRLGAIYPNPTSGETIVPYEVNEAGKVKLYLNNSLGETVLVLQEGEHTAGSYAAAINGANLQPGVYFLFLEVGNHRSFKRLLVRE